MEGVIVRTAVGKSTTARARKHPLIYIRSEETEKVVSDFKAFVMKGNVLDLAVAVILGAAFGAIVSSLVQDVIMPPIGLALGNADFKDLFLSLSGRSFPTLAAAKAAGAPVIAYGQFFNTVINFLVIAFFVFLVVRVASELQKPSRPIPRRRRTALIASARCRSRQNDARIARPSSVFSTNLAAPAES